MKKSQKVMKILKNNKSKDKFKIFRPFFIIFGLLFLSNPFIGIVDILPNFIGYFFLIFGLDGIKRLNGDIEYGVKNLKYLCGISALFFVLMFYTFKMDSSWILTLTFSYMAINIIFGTIACNGILNGIDYCTDRHGSDNFPSVYETKLMTKIYIWVKAALSVIPQLYALVEVEASSSLSVDIDYASILATKKYAIAVCILLSIGIAIAWLKYVVNYTLALKKDEKLMSSLTKAYVTDFSKNGIPINFFALNFGSGLILISHIFLYDFVLDTVHFFPEFISVLMSRVGIFILRKYLNCKGLSKYAIFSFLFQIAIFFYRNKFIENVIFELGDITFFHLIISSVLTLGYIIFTFLYFSKVHEITSESYEEMFGCKSTEIYEWGDIFLFIALAAGGANIICSVWRPYFVAIMIVSLFAAMYHFTKIYTRFENKY